MEVGRCGHPLQRGGFAGAEMPLMVNRPRGGVTVLG